MHELSLIASLFDALLEQARAHNARTIVRVNLAVGVLSGVVPELLESAFDMYKKGTIAEGATLVVERRPFEVRCRACGAVETREDFVFACPACGATDLEIVHGTELVLERIEAETADP
jgi:hydrogenase nickel incorporation protein HypA/HybF